MAKAVRKKIYLCNFGGKVDFISVLNRVIQINRKYHQSLMIQHMILNIQGMCVGGVLSHSVIVQLFATAWTITRQAPLSMGILQARILEWVAMPSSRGSSQSRD